MSTEKSQKDFQHSGYRKVLALLESLRQTASGELLFVQVERILGQVEGEHAAVEETYAGLLSSLLQLVARQVEPGSLLQVQLMMLDKLLQPPLSNSELDTLREYMGQQVSKLSQPGAAASIDAGSVESTLGSLFDNLSLVPAEPPAPDAPEAPPAANSAQDPRVERPGPSEAPPQTVDEPVMPEPRQTSTAATPVSQPPVANEASKVTPHPAVQQEPVAPRERAHRVPRSIHGLQESLADTVTETTSQAEDFGVLLEYVFGELRQATSSDDIDHARIRLMGQIENMMDGHRSFAKVLDTTTTYLQEIENNSQQLNDELTRVRLLSLTDELTALPNRRAFLRRLEDEVGRVQRYGVPLALAVIDLDHFKTINDEFGHGAGDAALKTYSMEVLSVFRHHDFVARYGGEEFVVLLPNTTLEGARKALAKVQRKATGTTFSVNGQREKIPRFSAGVAMYKAGETPSAFIERADHALYQAKRLGRDRIELDTSTVEDEDRQKKTTPQTESG